MMLSKSMRLGLIFLFAVTTLLGILAYALSSRREPTIVYRIARDPTWYAIDLLGKEKQMTAFSDDLLLRIAHEEGLSIEIMSVTFNALMTGLNSGLYDAILIPQDPSQVRKYPYYLYSNAIYSYGTVLVVQKGSGITSFTQLQGKLVGVQNPSLIMSNAPGEQSPVYVSFSHAYRGLEQLANGEIDGVIMESIPAHTYVQSLFPDRLAIVTESLTQAGIFLVSLDDARDRVLMNAFERGLAKMKENGEYTALLKKWKLVDPAIIETPVETK